MKHKTSAAKRRAKPATLKAAPSHSPLPWSEDPEGQFELAIEDAKGKVICRASLQDAPLIVLAVNSHANLVAALNRVIDDYDATGCDGCGVISQETFNAVVAAYQDAKPPVALKAAQPNATPSPASKWEDNALQFPRLIEEAQAAGAFTPEVVNDMAVSMDLDSKSVNELIDRAGREFERIKASL